MLQNYHPACGCDAQQSGWLTTAAYQKLCDHPRRGGWQSRVKMPMQGKADSLNAAMATAVMAYEVLNQFRRR
jgi:tRNA(Leu) C34 or U34 (ribose-2'-O)-methylase TrmL